MDYPNNKSFCIAPWVHLHLLPNGNAMPCCFWDQHHKRDFYGNINDHDNVNDLMNHDSFKELRLKFLSGEQHPGCDRCYNHEDNGRMNNSMRAWFNNTFKSEASRRSVENTQQDGTIEPNVVYLDIRYGNICNLKCRMCGYELSSSWHEDLIKLEKIVGIKEDNPRSQANKPKFIHVDAYDKIEPFLEYAEEIYFAGGEPLLYPEHTKMLDKLVETGNTKCRIKYNSNLSTLSYKGRDIIELWKKFDLVSVGASIDAMAQGVEFIRTNLKWKVFEKNFNRIKEELPLVHLFPAPTIGVLNIEIFPEFNKYCIENDWCKHAPFIPNFINVPDWQNPKILPDWYKERIIQKYNMHIDWIKQRMDNPDIEYAGQNQLKGLELVLSYLQENVNDTDTNEKLIHEAWQKLWSYKIADPELDWSQSLPELFAFFTEYKQRKGWTNWPD